MAPYYIARNEDIPQNYDENGFTRSELLEGTYDGGIVNYKCFLKAGCKVAPEKYADKTVLFFFGKGKGYVCDDEASYNITELAFYFPYFDKVNYEIHAVEDMEFVMSVVTLNDDDWKVYEHNHVKLPFFRLHSQCPQYVEDCKSSNTEARMVLFPKQLGRVILGTTRAIGEGTREPGHAAVHQWNYCVGNSDFKMTVDHKEPVNHYAGEFSFIPAGPDHDLVADPGKEVFYVWYEHFTRTKDFVVTQLPEK